MRSTSRLLSPATSPLSTLSADVDTASYCNLRRMVAQEYAPAVVPAGAVRTEELLNYFDYAYPAPVGSDLFGVSTQMSDCPWNDQTKLLVMGFATEKDGDASSAGANLVFLIDVSGSMDDPDKLPLVKDSFATLVEGLTERDRVSVVTYASGERVLLEGVPGDDKRRIMRAVDGLVAEGSTNGEAGLEQAYRLAESSFIEGGVNRVVMASDGDLNVGISSESELHDFVERKRATGVYLSVLGFGSGNYKDNKMETLADHGNGAYHYVDCAEEARRVLGRNLRANLVPLADDVKIQVEFNPDRVKGYRLIGYENRALADEGVPRRCGRRGRGGRGPCVHRSVRDRPARSAFEAGASALKYGSDADDRQDGRRSEANDRGMADVHDALPPCGNRRSGRAGAGRRRRKLHRLPERRLDVRRRCHRVRHGAAPLAPCRYRHPRKRPRPAGKLRAHRPAARLRNPPRRPRPPAAPLDGLRQEAVELDVQFGKALHARMLVQHAASHDHAHVAKRLQVLQGVAVEHDEVGRLARLDGARLVAQPQDARVAQRGRMQRHADATRPRCARSTPPRATCRTG